MAFPPWMTEVVSRPLGLGRVFYVNGVAGGSNNNNGIDPNTPFETITYAIGQCQANRNDFIIVLNAWSEATPIIINKHLTHIIGLGCDGMPIVTLTEDGDDDNIFEVGADFVEIAGFDLGGGGTSAGISLDGAGTWDMAYIHHCNFGSEYCGDTPLYGIDVILSAKTWKIDRCKFMGTGIGGGQLTSNGIHVAPGVNHQISNCLFVGCVSASAAINADATALSILNNDFVLATDVAGGAITLAVATSRCIVSNNRAAFGDTEAGLANPYLDNAGADANAWVANYKNEILTAPA